MTSRPPRATARRGRLVRYTSDSIRRRPWVASAFRGVARVLPSRAAPVDPVFIVGSPRSGTSLLFEVLDRSPRLASTHGESHFLWELFHPTRSPAWRSHRLGPEDVTGPERRAVYWMIHAITRGRRYLDKSPRNSLRVAYLDALFPTARFVFLQRDGRAVVSSLITAWRSDDASFPGTPVPGGLSIPGHQGQRWKFVVPPGWRDHAAGKPLAEVCAFQWVAATDAILSARDAIPAERWIDLRYEDLVRDPVEAIDALLDRLGIPADDEVLEAARSLPALVTKAVTPPREGKWRDEHPEEIASILPLIEPTRRRLGYDPSEPDERPARTAR